MLFSIHFQKILHLISQTLQEQVSLPALEPDSFDNKTQRIILFINSTNQSQHYILENFFRIYMELPQETAVFDCYRFPDFCKYNLQIPETPALKSYVDNNYVFTYGEPEWSVEKMAAFISLTILQDLFIEMEGTQTEKREQFKKAMIENNITKYFQFEGTREQKQEMNRLLMVMKGQAKISYNEDNKEALIAYRDGLDIEYKGDLHNNESLVTFVKTNLNDLFPKLRNENLQRLLDSNTVCLIIYDRTSDEQKKQVKQFKRFVYYHTKIQDLIGQKYQFAHSPTKNPEIQFGNKPIIMLLTSQNQIALFELNWNTLENELEQYALGKKQLVTFQPGAARQFQQNIQDDEF